jgi:N-acylglucosamine-6-phosphate 2-epimerase
MPTNIFEYLKGGLVVSCQPDMEDPHDDPLNRPEIMASFAVAAVRGGAKGIRADSPAHIAAIRAVVKVPIIGIYKVDLVNYAVRITPMVQYAVEIAQAGADIIALDATARPRPEGGDAAGFIRLVQAATGKPVLADVATFEEGLAAAAAGAESVATTLQGYTSYATAHGGPDVELVDRLAKALSVPVIAEGRYNTPALARQGLKRGAWAITVGSAITRPRTITQEFVREMRKQ